MRWLALRMNRSRTLRWAALKFEDLMGWIERRIGVQ